MIVYPFFVEPCETKQGPAFIAKFPDIPELVDCIGDDKDDAIGNAVQRLSWVLTEIYLAGRPMPPFSAVLPGQIGVPAPFYWSFT